MTSIPKATAPEAIVAGVGGPENIVSLTHCATRLRFVLVDASRVAGKDLDAIPDVLGVVPQTGDRYQVVIGGAVESVYTKIMALPSMKGIGTGALSDAAVKAALGSAELIFKADSDAWRNMFLVAAVPGILFTAGAAGIPGIPMERGC